MAAGWNRDGLALRAAGHLAGQSSCEKRLLIVLTDASPNDEQRMAPVSGAVRGKEYSGDAGIEDAAMEVRQLKAGNQGHGCILRPGQRPGSARKITEAVCQDQGDGAACGYGWKFADQPAAVGR